MSDHLLRIWAFFNKIIINNISWCLYSRMMLWTLIFSKIKWTTCSTHLSTVVRMIWLIVVWVWTTIFPSVTHLAGTVNRVSMNNWGPYAANIVLNGASLCVWTTNIVWFAIMLDRNQIKKVTPLILIAVTLNFEYEDFTNFPQTESMKGLKKTWICQNIYVFYP